MKNAQITTVDIATLVPDQANVRKRGDRAKSTLAASLKQFGPARSIVLDSRDIVRAGNGTLEAFAANGGTEILVVEPKPGQLVAVKRNDWSKTDAVGYGLADNRIAELAEWDNEGLADLIKGLEADEFDISTLGWAEHELEPLLAAEWKPVELEDLPTGGSGKSGHTITIDDAAWETIGSAIDARREQAGNVKLSEAQCLELICADYLIPRSDSLTTPAP